MLTTGDATIVVNVERSKESVNPGDDEGLDISLRDCEQVRIMQVGAHQLLA